MGPNSAAWVTQVSDEAIKVSWGVPTFLRGRAYRDAGHVIKHSVGRNGAIDAVVQGAGGKTYRTFLHHDQRGISSACSCPVAMGCKHAVAVLLAVRDSESEGTSSWEDLLGGLLPASAAGEGDQEAVELCLEFRLDGPLENLDALVLRPLRMGKRGWVKSQASWGDITSNYRGLDYDPRQREVLLQMAQLVGYHQYSYGNLATIPLSSLGPLGWSLLDQATAAGIPFMAGEGLKEVTIDFDPVRVWLDITAHGDGARELVISGDLGPVVPGGRRFLIGEPAHGLGELGPGGRLRLHPLAEPLPGVIRNWFNQDLKVTIPAQDADRFQLMYLPFLAQKGLVAPGSWNSEELPQPGLTLQLTHEPGHRLLLSWGFRYTSQTAATSVPFRPRRGDFFRDLPAEHALEAAAAKLAGDFPALLESHREKLLPTAALSHADAARFITETLPLLEASGVAVTQLGEVLEYSRAAEPPVIALSTEDTDDLDWFNLRIQVTVAGQEVPFEPLFRALAAGDDAMLLDDGTWFLLDHPELSRLRQLLAEARELMDSAPGGQIRISPYQAGWWEELTALGVMEGQSRRWLERVQALRDAGVREEPVAVPGGLAATLRPYQERGFAWLVTLWDAGLGGVLADDMGLGKTLQTLALVERARELGQLDQAPVLVVAPASVVGAWAEEAARFAPGLSVAVVRATEARRGTPLADEIAGAHVVVTSYTLLRLEDEAYLGRRWSGLVLDEAQFVKNPRSRTHQLVRRIGSPFTLVITGTPLENTLSDLWSMFSLAAPGLFPRLDEFTESYRTPVERDADMTALARLRSRIRPFMLRRTKREVVAELPEKVEQVMRLELTPEHRRRYDQHLTRERTRVLGMLQDMDRNRVAIFRALTKLRQLALDPRLVDPDLPATASAKITAVVEQIRELAGEGHRALVFSSFTGFLRLVREALEQEGIEYVYLDGRTRDRPARIARFREGNAPVFLISLKAGGFGLTLTEADYVFVLDPWWNPAAENQAVDRAHRIGQTQAVNVYRMVAVDTIEEKVVALQQRKRDLFTSVVDTGEFRGTAITAADIRGLLE